MVILKGILISGGLKQDMGPPPYSITRCLMMHEGSFVTSELNRGSFMLFHDELVWS
jgi:hypothetical protein